MLDDVMREQIGSFIRRTFPMAQKQKVAADQDLLESGILDSLGVLEIVRFVEREFHVSVDDEELVPENFRSIDRLTAFVAGKRSDAGAANGRA